MKRVSRRTFARSAFAAAAAAAVLPQAIAQTSAPATAEGTAATPALSAASHAEVEARIAWILGVYGARLSEAQRADIRRIVAGGQSGLDAMRAYPLDNETGPPVPFRVFNGRAASASGSLRSVSGARGAGPAAASGSSDQVSLPPGSKKP